MAGHLFLNRPLSAVQQRTEALRKKISLYEETETHT